MIGRFREIPAPFKTAIAVVAVILGMIAISLLSKGDGAAPAAETPKASPGAVSTNVDTKALLPVDEPVSNRIFAISSQASAILADPTLTGEQKNDRLAEYAPTLLVDSKAPARKPVSAPLPPPIVEQVVELSADKAKVKTSVGPYNYVIELVRTNGVWQIEYVTVVK